MEGEIAKYEILSPIHVKTQKFVCDLEKEADLYRRRTLELRETLSQEI